MLYLLLGLFIVFHLIVIGMYFDNLLPLSKTKKIKKAYFETSILFCIAGVIGLAFYFILIGMNSL